MWLPSAATGKETNTLVELQRDFADERPLFGRVPFLAISVYDRQRLGTVFGHVVAVEAHLHTRVTTSDLNRLLEDWVTNNPPPLFQKRPVKIKYGTQTETNPPTITLFVNRPQGISDQYLRYLERNLRETVDLFGVPVRWHVRSSS